MDLKSYWEKLTECKTITATGGENSKLLNPPEITFKMQTLGGVSL